MLPGLHVGYNRHCRRGPDWLVRAGQVTAREPLHLACWPLTIAPILALAFPTFAVTEEQDEHTFTAA